MQLEMIEQGFVSRRQPDEASPVTAGPRAIVTQEGELVCTYMAQSALGINDFVPLLARSSDNGTTWQDEGPIWRTGGNRFAGRLLVASFLVYPSRWTGNSIY